MGTFHVGEQQKFRQACIHVQHGNSVLRPCGHIDFTAFAPSSPVLPEV